MKLSKKLVSMILVAAMLIAQVSVLPFATESYSSGKGDSASYALAVPDSSVVQFGTAVDGVDSWVDSSASLGRNDDDTGYASDRRGKIFIAEDNGERFFVLNPSAKYAEVIFKNAPANTYTAESPAIFNGVPSAINYKKLNAMAFRIKAMGTVADKLVIDIQLTNKNGTTVAYTAKNDMLFMDAATGAVSKIGYTESGIEFAGNANGWLYVPFTGFIGKDDAKLSDCKGEFFEVSNAYNPNATGYKGIKVTFKNDAFNSESKKLYFGDALFVEDETSFRKVHGSPAAPTVKELGKDFIKLNAQDGVVYSLSEDGTYSASGEFTGLTAGKKYTIYSKFTSGTGVSSCIVYTKGVADIEVIYTDYDTIKVYAVSGMEYCLGGDWNKKNTTGVFEGLEYNKSYKVYVREVGGSETKTKTVKTTALPYTTGMEETAYYALNISDNITALTGALGSFTGNITSLPVTKKDGVNYVQISPSGDATATIGANALTYNKPTYGLPTDIVRYEYINGIAFRMSVEGGTDGVESKFDITLHNNHKIQNGVYDFINVADGSVSSITYNNGFVVKGALDGWLVISFENIRFSEDVALTGVYNQSIYRDILLTFTQDWTGRTLNVGTGLFFEDYTTFIRAYSLPHNHVYYRNKTVIDITPADGVEYLLVGTDKWVTDGKFEKLTPNTVYTIRARYIGRTDYSEFTVKTRLADPILTAPVLSDLTVTATGIIVNAPLGDHEYSVDGVNWTENGVFEGLLSGTAYNLVARLFETTKQTTPLVVITKNTLYSTGKSDSASYLFRVPLLSDAAGTDETGAYITRAENNNSSIQQGVNMDPTKYYLKDKNGYNFIEIIGGETSTVYEFKSAMKYDGAPFISSGLPQDIKDNGIKAIAVRFAIEGNKDDEYSLFDVLVKILSKTNYTRKKGQMMFVDAKTGKTTNLEYRNGIKFYGDVDGWVVIPCESFTDVFAEDILTKYEGLFRINLKKEFANNKFYLGEVLAVADIDKFLQARSAPGVPTLLEKDTESISVVAVSGIAYSLDKINWNTSGVFTGLKDGEKYEIYAKYTVGDINGDALVSEPLVVYADEKDPSMDAIEIESLTATKLVIKAIPGLKYTVDGGYSWTEFGVFDNLEPNTKYTLYGASKVSQGTTTPTLTFITPKADNPYDLGDGSSIYMQVSSYGEYYQNKYGYSKQVSQNGKPGSEGGQIKITELNGEKVIEFRVQEGYPVINSKGEVAENSHSNVVASQTKEYNDDGCVDYGFPTGIWIKDCFGIAIRLIVEDTPDTVEISNLYYEYYDPIQGKESQKPFGGTCYIIDKKTETYSKKVVNQFQFKEGFDGWILIPFKTLYEKNSQLNAAYIQENWACFRFFNYDGRTDSAKYGNSNWSETAMYFGDSVVVEDVNTFMENYAKNTEEKVVSDAHNIVTVDDIPGVMANDCTGAEVYSGITEIKGIRAQSVHIEKPYEKSKALSLAVSGYSSISITNDALNFKEVPKELEYKVMDSIGMAFYMNIPKSISGTVGFKVKVQEQYTEYHEFNGTYYYTVNNGVATKNYGQIELQPGFNGVVVLPFELFSYDSLLSEYVDGLINNPETIGFFTLEFAVADYPALNSGNLYVDDFYFYQSLEEYITFMLKTQGTDVYEIVENVVDLKADDEYTFPREMANNCSSITKGEGIFSTDNVKLALVAATEDEDAYINVTIGDGASSVMFENFAKYSDEMSFDEYNNLIGSTGVTFWVSVPEDAPMIVGLDLEVRESETEYFWYDPNRWYYTVENGVVTQYYGYLEFKPGFEGAVVVPLECFYFDEFSSTAVDGVLYVELIDYFGFYFDTGFYASIGGTTISIDDIAFCQGNFRFIDAVWAKQTGNSITETDPMYWSVSADKVFEVVEVAQSPVKNVAPMNNVGSMSTVLGLALLAVAAIIGRRKAEEN